jgi:hypothetical protein
MKPTGVYVYFDSEDQALINLYNRGFRWTDGGDKWDFANPEGTVEARIGQDEHGTFLEYRGDES